MKNKRTYKVAFYANDFGGRLSGCLAGIGKCQMVYLHEDLPDYISQEDGHRLLKGDGIFGVEITKLSEVIEGNYYVIKFDDDCIAVGKHIYVKNGLPYFQFGESGEIHAMPYPLNMLLRMAAVCVSVREKMAV